MTDTQNQTVVGLFDDFPQAQAVARTLEDQGFNSNEISIVANDARGEYASKDGETHTGDTAAGAGKGAAIGGVAGLALGLAALAIPGIGPVVAAGPLATALTGAGIGAVAGGLIGALTNMGVPEEDAHYYNEGVRSGGALVMVKASADRARRAADILEGAGAENVDENGRPAVDTMSSRTDRTTTAPPVPNEAMPYAPSVGSPVAGEREVTIPVAEERVDVGKRTVSRGGVRVFSHVAEQPVTQNVDLREEHVRVDRRPVDRDASEADFQDRTIEVRETGEEPVITKRNRVVEEVVVGKDVTSRTQQVNEQVRRTEVNVEKMPDTAAAPRTRAVGSSDYYDESSPAYLYGTTMASDPRYRGKDWSAIEPHVRRDWEARGEGAWESAKDSIRRAWDKVTGRT